MSSLTAEEIQRLTLANNERLARTAQPKAPRKPTVRPARPTRPGTPDEVYNVTTGKLTKLPDKPKMEGKIRKALKGLNSTHESGLHLSQMIDLAELVGFRENHPLIERAVDRLRDWEIEQDEEFLVDEG